ncbi:TauD/TfdA family dioxygenase [Amycolatopsis sp. cg13]|uniref:TauD/TfdA family dioxygenase n=1 Tax=Amycolatopsis sp. cg13 TaxID=3238807 RepID=UPI00352652D6
MPISGHSGQSLPPATILSDVEAKSFDRIARDLTSSVDSINSREWLTNAADAWHDTPAAPRKRLSRFRRDSGREGVFLIRSLPVDEETLPDTPSESGSAPVASTVPAALITLFASGLGNPMAFAAEKSGALVHDVVPVRGNEQFQGNEGSVVLSFHNENAFHPFRPDYVLLLCLRADHDRVAGLRTSSVRTVLPHLSTQCRETLSRTEFATAAPPSFGGAGHDGGEPHAVLAGAPDDPDVCVDFAATRPLSEAAAEALRQLQEELVRHSSTVRLVPGDLAVVDNRIALHGRTSFTPRYDGRDRWLQRGFALRDLRRSRELRPADGHILLG